MSGKRKSRSFLQACHFARIVAPLALTSILSIALAAERSGDIGTPFIVPQSSQVWFFWVTTIVGISIFVFVFRQNRSAKAPSNHSFWTTQHRVKVWGFEIDASGSGLFGVFGFFLILSGPIVQFSGLFSDLRTASSRIQRLESRSEDLEKQLVALNTVTLRLFLRLPEKLNLQGLDDGLLKCRYRIGGESDVKEETLKPGKTASDVVCEIREVRRDALITEVRVGRHDGRKFTVLGRFNDSVIPLEPVYDITLPETGGR